MLALVDFPKQVVVALAMTVEYMTRELKHPRLSSLQRSVFKMPSAIGPRSPR